MGKRCPDFYSRSGPHSFTGGSGKIAQKPDPVA
jgi:hypothetical protein